MCITGYSPVDLLPFQQPSDAKPPHSPKPLNWEEHKKSVTPDTPLVRAVVEHDKKELPENVFNHSHRAYYLSTAVARTQFPEWKWDPEVYFITCMFHDIGCTPSNLKATKMSFEFFGGILARDWLLKKGATQDQADLVAEVIFRHTDFVPGKITTHGQLIHIGTLMDNTGIHKHLIHESTVEEIVKAYPRLGWTKAFADTMDEEVELKPWSHTTALAAQGFGEKIMGNPLMNKYE